MLKALKWDLSPLTCNQWLNVFMQLVNVDNIEEKETNFVFPQYSSHAFIQFARVSAIQLIFTPTKRERNTELLPQRLRWPQFTGCFCSPSSCSTCVSWTLDVSSSSTVYWPRRPCTTFPQNTSHCRSQVCSSLQTSHNIRSCFEEVNGLSLMSRCVFRVQVDGHCCLCAVDDAVRNDFAGRWTRRIEILLTSAVGRLSCHPGAFR